MENEVEFIWSYSVAGNTAIASGTSGASSSSSASDASGSSGTSGVAATSVRGTESTDSKEKNSEQKSESGTESTDSKELNQERKYVIVESSKFTQGKLEKDASGMWAVSKTVNCYCNIIIQCSIVSISIYANIADSDQHITGLIKCILMYL